MTDIQTLHQKLETLKDPLVLGPDCFKSKVPVCIKNNIKPGFGEREYQQEAFGRFVHLWEKKSDGKPTQLLFHMATGSGKTLIMAGLILYLYEKGYRNFLFFVNSTNIIEKTRDNFLNPRSGKFLFAESIKYGEKQVLIKQVENFEAAHPDNINIVFSTIQGLHLNLITPRENSITYEDFESKEIVFISDEAHHINADTKNAGKLSNDELLECVSWENTVTRIFNANSKNIMLEFTATADLNNTDISKKYCDKLIFDYPLKQFRLDGFSKEVKVLQADLEPIERALQGVVLSQYRRKIFEKNGKAIKPVILLKSKTIEESKAFYSLFISTIKNLSEEILLKINKGDDNSPVRKAFSYFESLGILIENLISELKGEFSEDKCISVNSKDESEAKQIAINSLEEHDNAYRAVFAVDKLNEGWDVLNLFDIIRLYDTRDTNTKTGKVGKTTMSEAQLIGRGARYCPFQVELEQPLYLRKYDVDLKNELRICEELYYHSSYNPKYITELNIALVEIGIKAKDAKQIDLFIKPAFKDTPFYKTAFVFLNDRVKNDNSDIFALPNTMTEKTYKYNLHTGYMQASLAFEKADTSKLEKTSETFTLGSFGNSIIRKAINRLDFYKYTNLNFRFPHIKSTSEFITSDSYLNKIKIEVEGQEDQVNNLSAKEKLNITVSILEDIAQILTQEQSEYIGTKEFKHYLLKDEIDNKTLNIVNEGQDKEYGIGQSVTTNEELRLNLADKDWYVFNDNYGTSEEKYLVKFVNKVYEKLKSKYDEIYLVRNERFFKIFNFDDGKPTEPDFILYLVNKKKKQELHYQVFIEPKGTHLLEHDAWKETFLKSLKEYHLIQQLWDNKKYIVWGMPFYNEENRKTEFETGFNKLLTE